MKKQSSNQPVGFVRKSNEEILESMKQKLLTHGSDPEVSQIMSKLLTFTPEKDLAIKIIGELMVLARREYYEKIVGKSKYVK